MAYFATNKYSQAPKQTALSNEQYEFIRELIYEQCRINLGPHKKDLVTTRLSRRLRQHNLNDFESYIRLLQSNKGEDELYDLIDAISTNHTYFFREDNHFDFLKTKILPDARKRGGTFRMWSAACSSGEEPYSAAILFDQFFRSQGNWKIECSDISTRILKKASEGIFPKERVDRIEKALVPRYFQEGQGEWKGSYRFKPEVRKHLNFQRLNLMDRKFPFSEKFDIIFCRNVMIYFDKPTQEDLVNRLCQYIKPGGYLYIGHAESLNPIKHPLKTIKPAIYQL